MRDRLVAILVSLTVAVVMLFGVPRAYVLADLVQSTELRKVERSADLAAVAVAARQEGPGEVSPTWLSELLHAGESIEVVTADGQTVTAAPAGETSTPPHADDLVQTRELADGTRVTLRRSGELVEDRVSDALLSVVLLGLLLVLASAVAARIMADRLARPFRELAGAAEAIGQGRFDVQVPHSTVAEAEAIGGALRRGAERLAELRLRERDIAANASHELRTPISALRLQMEDLASWPQTPPEVAAELRGHLVELDRLGAAVRTYLDRTQEDRVTDVDRVDLAQVVRETLERRRRERGTGTSARRRRSPALVLVDEPARPLHVLGSAAAVEEILDLLLEDAAARGATHVLVEVDATDELGRVRLELVGEDTAPAAGAARSAATATALSLDGRLSTLDGHLALMLRRAP